ncbi:MAG: thioesterase family protein [bacterium]
MARQAHERCGFHEDRTDPRPYMEARAEVKVRFHEVDVMGIVWHANYFGYFEEARRVLAAKHDMDYPVLMANNLAAPVVSASISYHAPARMGDTLEVVTRFYKSDSVKLEFGYEIRLLPDRTPVATGRTVQVLTTPDRQLILVWPPLFRELQKKWETEWTLP